MIGSASARKYIIYAIGEILLVMIGILLALQVNNWNEDRKERKYEIEVITEIYEGLRADSARLVTWWLPRIENKRSGIDRFSHYVYEKKIADDSTLYETYYDMRQEFLISLNMGPFESLKIKGIELISNKRLRFWLVDVFESVLPRQLKALQKMDEENIKDGIDIYHLLWIESITKMPDGSFGISRQLRSDELLNDQLLIQLISSERIKLGEIERRIKAIKETINATLIRLEDFLEVNEIDIDKPTIGSIIGVRGMLSDSLAVRTYNR